MNDVLIAGVGNIFFGDDAFGCEVASALARRPLPEGVRVVDFGIRCYDLAYALLDSNSAVILVDAIQRAEPPGTLILIEPELTEPSDCPSLDAHRMDCLQVLQMARRLGGQPQNLFLVGCVPATLEPEDGSLGLSPPVLAAIPAAIRLIDSLLAQLLSPAANSQLP